MKKRVIVIGLALIIFVLGMTGEQLSREQEIQFLKSNIESVGFGNGQETILEDGDPNNQIAVLEINGQIIDSGEETVFGPVASYNHQATLKAIESIKNNDQVKGVLLKVDSPGGSTYHSAELKKHLDELKAEKDIPIYVSMGTTAASGGYMISMPADKIYADNETVTGSIGVILQAPNFSGFMDEHGIKMNTYKSGANKDMGSSFKDPSDEEKKIFESLINESYDEFVNIVAEGRDMSKDEVKKLADGRIYSGKQAKEKGLVDEIGYANDALAGLMNDQSLEGAQVIDVTPKQNLDYFSRLFQNLTQAPESKNKKMSAAEELQYFNDVIKHSEAPQLYYLYGGE